MKKIFYTLVLLMTCLAACTSDFIEENLEKIPSNEADSSELKALTISEASIEGHTRYTDTSRKTRFMEGDTIGIFVADTKGSYYTEDSKNIPAVYKEGKWNLELAEPLMIDPSRPAVVKAYFPYTPDWELDSFSDEYQLNLEKVLHGPLGSQEILESDTGSVTSSGVVKLTFFHMSSRIQVYVDNQSNGYLNEDGAPASIESVMFNYTNMEYDSSTEEYKPASFQWLGYLTKFLVSVDNFGDYIRFRNYAEEATDVYLNRVNGLSSKFDGYVLLEDWRINDYQHPPKTILDFHITLSGNRTVDLPNVEAPMFFMRNEYIIRITIGGSQENNRPATRSSEDGVHIIDLWVPDNAN